MKMAESPIPAPPGRPVPVLPYIPVAGASRPVPASHANIAKEVVRVVKADDGSAERPPKVADEPQSAIPGSSRSSSMAGEKSHLPSSQTHQASDAVVRNPSGEIDSSVSQAGIEKKMSLDEITALAKKAGTELDAHNEDSIPMMLTFGETIYQAKKNLPHGDLLPWCKFVLGRSPSTCAAYRRLYERREDIQPARDWALQQDHPRAKSCSLESLWLLINARDKTMKAIRADESKNEEPKPRSLIDQLNRQLAENEREFAALRDDLPPETEARVLELLALETDEARAELAAIARRFHWRLSDLVKTCGDLQVSKSASA